MSTRASSSVQLEVVSKRLNVGLPSLASVAIRLANVNGTRQQLILQQREKPKSASRKGLSSDQLDKLVNRVRGHTTSSLAARYDFDQTEHHLQYLTKRDPTLFRQTTVSGDQADDIFQRISSKSTGHVRSRSYCQNRLPITKAFMTVNDEELDRILSRITKPTLSSQGVIDDLYDNNNDNSTDINKCHRNRADDISTRARRFRGTKKLSCFDMSSLTARLARPKSSMGPCRKSNTMVETEEEEAGVPPRPKTSISFV